MLVLDELRLELGGYTRKIGELAAALRLDNAAAEIAELERLSGETDFWNDAAESAKTLQKLGTLKRRAEEYNKLKSSYDDTLALIELADEEGESFAEDKDAVAEIFGMADAFKAELQRLSLVTMLAGEYDGKNAILTLHAGAGGTEAQDWVEMLYRMYNRYAERHNFKVTLLDYLDGEEAGIKSASVLITGDNAYGFLKSEHGVHRLVRVSPFDSSGRRHTSFASLEVMPEIDDDTKIEVREDEYRMEVYRASGAGGQKVNKTSSAVRIIHLPTGITTCCQTERSQNQNKEYALRMLKSRLIEIKEREHLDKISDIKGEQLQIAWGAQIRSYVFMPYTLVKDHRTGYENGNVNAVMDGDLDGFINAYLISKAGNDDV